VCIAQEEADNEDFMNTTIDNPRAPSKERQRALVTTAISHCSRSLEADVARAMARCVVEIQQAYPGCGQAGALTIERSLQACEQEVRDAIAKAIAHGGAAAREEIIRALAHC
jgi:hypothetical protein